MRLTELMSNAADADLLRRRGIDALGPRLKARLDADDSIQAAIASGRALEIMKPDSAG